MAQSPNGIPSTGNVVNSITRQALYEPFNLQVARGQIYGHSILSLFGYNANIQSSTATTAIPLWENSTTYTYPTTATTMTVVSTSASDACNMLIQGLDANFNPVSETIKVNGTTGVTTVKSYLRINNLTLVTPPSGYLTNQGVITVKQSSNIVAQINAGIGKNQAAIYTVPAGYSFYLDSVNISTDNAYTGTPLYYNVQAINNLIGVELTILQQPFTALFSIDRNSNPFAYPEKTDLQWQISAPSAGSALQVGIVVCGKVILNG